MVEAESRLQPACFLTAKLTASVSVNDWSA
jgi:hypothetical protein